MRKPLPGWLLVVLSLTGVVWAVPLAHADPDARQTGTRGMLSSTTFWDQTFKTATSADCVGQGEEIVESQRAWRLPSGALACTMDPSGAPWGGRITGVDLFFDPNVNADTALEAVAGIMPTDTQQVRSNIGSNRDDSKYKNGSCQQVLYGSNIIAAAVSHADPQWTGDPHLVLVTLYTGNVSGSDGSDRRYEPASVHLAPISIASSDKVLPC